MVGALLSNHEAGPGLAAGVCGNPCSILQRLLGLDRPRLLNLNPARPFLASVKTLRYFWSVWIRSGRGGAGPRAGECLAGVSVGTLVPVLRRMGVAGKPLCRSVQKPALHTPWKGSSF